MEKPPFSNGFPMVLQPQQLPGSMLVIPGGSQEEWQNFVDLALGGPGERKKAWMEIRSVFTRCMLNLINTYNIVYIYMHIIYISICIYAYYVYIYLSVYMHIMYTSIYMYICILIYIYIHIFYV